MRSILILKYLNDFSGVGSVCEDTSYTSWNITVKKKTYQTYLKVCHQEMVDILLA